MIMFKDNWRLFGALTSLLLFVTCLSFPYTVYIGFLQIVCLFSLASFIFVHCRYITKLRKEMKAYNEISIAEELHTSNDAMFSLQAYFEEKVRLDEEAEERSKYFPFEDKDYKE